MRPDSGANTTIIFVTHTGGFRGGDGVYGDDETIKTVVHGKDISGPAGAEQEAKNYSNWLA